MKCPKYDLEITGCSMQVSLFVPYICENCLSKAINISESMDIPEKVNLQK
jgi:hypothetical protein